MRVRVTALEKPKSGNYSCLIKDKKALSREQASSYRDHQQVVEDWPPSAMCGSVKAISYVPLELNKLKHFGDVYMQIILSEYTGIRELPCFTHSLRDHFHLNCRLR